MRLVKKDTDAKKEEIKLNATKVWMHNDNGHAKILGTIDVCCHMDYTVPEPVFDQCIIRNNNGNIVISKEDVI